MTIQRWLRGHEGRKAAAKQRQKISRQIEEDYGRFDREFKRSREYDLKRYLRDKKKLREKMGLGESMESIAEMVSDSQSNKAKPQTIFDAMFKQRTQVDKDPLSLIAVYAKKHQAPQRHAPKPATGKKQRTQAKTHTKTLTTSESIIEDYPEDFEDSVPKDTSTIEEDLPSSKSSLKPLKALHTNQTKGLVPAVGAVAPKPKPAKKRTVRDSPAESIADEIIDEVPDSIKEDSILEESGLDGSKPEIIKDEYEADNAKISEAKQKIEARNRIRFGLASAQTDERPKDVVHKEAVILGMGE